MTIESMLTAGTDTTATGATSTAATTEAAATTTAATTEATTTQQTEAKTETSAETAATGTKAEEKPAETAPEKYEDFKAPEGETLSPDVVAEVSALGKELGLSQDKAQKIVDAAHKLGAKALEAQQTSLDTIHSQWQDQVRADKEIGGDKLTENLATAKAAMLATSTPQLQVLLERSGLGNHPEVIRHFLRIAPAFKEDKNLPQGTSTGDNKSTAKVLYPNNA